MIVEADGTRRLNRSEAAAAPMLVLESRGAVFMLNAHGVVRADLDWMNWHGLDDWDADSLAAVFLDLSDELGAILRLPVQ